MFTFREIAELFPVRVGQSDLRAAGIGALKGDIDLRGLAWIVARMPGEADAVRPASKR